MYGTLYRRILLPLFDRVIKRRHTLQYWEEAEASQWWSAAELEAFQVRSLRDLLEHAQATCPYFAQAWETIGFRANQVDSLEDLRRLPLMTRQLIREHRLAMRTTLPMPRLSKATGGSTGEPLQFDLNTDSNDRRVAMTYRGYGWAGAEPGTRQLHIWGTSSTRTPAWKRWKAACHRAFDRQMILSCFDFTPVKMVRHVQRMNAYQPEVIIAYTNPLYEFARYIEQEGLTAFQPRSLVVGAEKLHDYQRQTIERVFRAPVFETYGSREFMLIGAECDRHEGLHLSQENLIVEILDDGGRPTPDGEIGNVVITDLYNYGMPFIRYVNGDRAVAGYGTCSCGRGLPLLRSVQGRQLDILETSDGRKVSGEFFVHLVKDFPAIRRFQVSQLSPDHIVLRLVVDGGFTLSDHQHLDSEIRQGLGPKTRFEMQFVADIPLTSTGKHRVVLRETASVVS